MMFCLWSFLSGGILDAILLAAALPALVAGEYLVQVFQNGADVVVEASGSLNTTGLVLETESTSCDPDSGGFAGDTGVCVGPSILTPVECYNITGPTDFSGGSTKDANSSTGFPSILDARGIVCVPINYESGTETLNGTSVYEETTLAALNFFEAVDLMWTFDGTTSETARFVVSVPPTPAPVTPTMAPVSMDKKCYVDYYHHASPKIYDDSKFLRGGEEYHLGEVCTHASYALKVCCQVSGGDAECVTCDECATDKAVNDACCAWAWWDEDKNGNGDRRSLNGIYYGGCIHQNGDENYQCCKCDEFYHCAGPEEDCMTVCSRAG